uniref:Uncharacterized protein n=1 Tax=Oryza sativa subsp. japonica TaxID=39947 RepID=Q8LNJ9_ORYSJ|nr:Hypothetical protein [Oryza sativa Japonica Group]
MEEVVGKPPCRSAPRIAGAAADCQDFYQFSCRRPRPTEVINWELLEAPGIRRPYRTRFTNTDSACCGSGIMGAEDDCLPNSTLCTDHEGFLFWDRVHPSQRSAQLTAATFYDGMSHFTTPFNFKQLVAKKMTD